MAIIPQLSDKLFNKATERRQVVFKNLDITRGENGVEFPQEGGILTYYEGEKYPWKGFLQQEPVLRSAVNAITEFKRTLLGLARFMTTKPVRYFVPLMIFLPRTLRDKIIWSFLAEMMDIFDESVHPYYPKPELFCKSGREIWRVGMKVVEELGGNVKDYNFKGRVAWRILMGICMTWEYDEVYRFPGQDIFGELDKELLKQNAVKEIGRLMELAMARTPSKIQQKKFGHLKLAVKVGSWVFRKELKKLVELICEMDLGQVKLDFEDEYHCLCRTYYDFKGVSFSERFERRKQIDSQWKNELLLNKRIKNEQIS